MASTHVFLLLLTVAVVAPIDTNTTNELCSVCDCEGEELTCECTTKKVMDLTQKFMSAAASKQRVTFKGCLHVSLHTGSFADLKHLQKLEIANTKEVVFSMGVFESLSYLGLTNITNAIFKENAFLNNTLQVLHFEGLTAVEVPTHAFYGLKNVTNVRFVDVSIGNVQRNAFLLEMVQDAVITIENCVLSSVAEDGFVVSPASRFNMNNSTLVAASPEALQVNATESAAVSGCQFGAAVSSSSVRLSAPTLTIDNNIVECVSCLNVTSTKLTFDGNSFKKDKLTSVLRQLRWVEAEGADVEYNVTKNKFPCSCDGQMHETLAQGEMRGKGVAFLESNGCLQEFCGRFLPFKQLQRLLGDTEKCAEAVKQRNCWATGGFNTPPNTTTTTTTTTTIRPTQAARNEETQKNGVVGLYNAVLSMLLTLPAAVVLLVAT